MLKQQPNSRYSNITFPFNVKAENYKTIKRYMSKFSEISYRAITELVDLNPKSAAVAAECLGRSMGLDGHLGFAVLANSAWRTEIKPNYVVPFINENLLAVIEQIEGFSTAYPIMGPLAITAITLIASYKIDSEIEFPGFVNEDDGSQEPYEKSYLKNNLKEKPRFLDLLEQNPFSVKK